MAPPLLTLASASPRRRELLGALGLSLEVRPAHTDETPRPGEAPADYARRVAREKARAVDGELVLAADTTVAVDGALLGKPRDEADAARMLRSLSGRSHQVISAVCVRRPAIRLEFDAVTTTEVEVAPLSEAVIAWYVGTGEPRDKAGAYAVQGLFGAFVRAVRGSVTGVIGLPLDETLGLLRRAGYPLPWEAR
ncbi:MAG: septum formation protein Maf [Anaeromyxobacter sp.]|nr:septum formation protein Maf [Anaeromyxobacter sp.]MBL0274691.1 septum formation protein Maf [Anaeromyxobacter sp.]